MTDDKNNFGLIWGVKAIREFCQDISDCEIRDSMWRTLYADLQKHGGIHQLSNGRIYAIPAQLREIIFTMGTTR